LRWRLNLTLQISQGSASTYFRWSVQFRYSCVKGFFRDNPSNFYWNRFIFDRQGAKNKLAHFFWDTVYIFANTQKFYWKNFDMKRRFIVKVWDWESIVVHWLCTLLAAVSIYRIAVVSATRFVKCNKCNHFFAVIPDSETKLNVKDSGNDARQQSDRRPPPPPRKVCHWVKILREVFVLRCVSEKMCKLWNGVPQNYKDRFWRHLAKILRWL